jgi:hypothetical protein
LGRTVCIAPPSKITVDPVALAKTPRVRSPLRLRVELLDRAKVAPVNTAFPFTDNVNVEPKDSVAVLETVRFPWVASEVLSVRLTAASTTTSKSLLVIELVSVMVALVENVALSPESKPG